MGVWAWIVVPTLILLWASWKLRKREDYHLGPESRDSRHGKPGGLAL